MTSPIPSSLLLTFFQEATTSLNEYKTEEIESDGVPTLSFLRKALLQVQRDCLAQVVADYSEVSVDQVQLALKEICSHTEDKELKKAMDAMNNAARLAFCRVVLRQECRWDAVKGPRTLNTGESPMTRSDLMEYAGLCNGVVRLPNVQKHLRDGSRLFDDIEASKSPAPVFPQSRLEKIQQQLLRAVGFDVDYGKTEIQHYFSDNSMDPELVRVLSELSSNMSVALTNASLESAENLSDQDKGGVTRVVAVSYSEKIVTPDGQEVSTTATAPQQESMVEHDEKEQLAQLQMARQAASLEQSILGELLSMDELDRKVELNLAKKAHDDFLRQAMEIPPGPDRISFLTSVDSETQRKLLVHKLWSKLLMENGGKPPTVSP